jgi:peptidyl-tRNA hydrolase
MGKGKIGAQCGHAALGAYRKAIKRTPLNVKAWETFGEAKVVVKVNTEEEM